MCRSPRKIGQASEEPGSSTRRLSRALHALTGRFKDVIGSHVDSSITLTAQVDSPSTLIRAVSEQRLLGLVVAAGMPADQHIVGLPDIDDPMTVTFVCLDERHGDNGPFFAQLERIFLALRHADTAQLFKCFRGCTDGIPPRLAERLELQGLRRNWSAEHRTTLAMPCPHVAFIGHLLSAGDLRDLEPALAHLSDEECLRIIRGVNHLMDPFVIKDATVRSRTGQRVRLSVIGIAMTAEQALAARSGDGAGLIHRRIRQAVCKARDLGAQVVGLGGYTSILTNNCCDLSDRHIGITSGNTLTTAAALGALTAAQRRIGIAHPRLAVIGATGNIGRALAEVAADSIREIVLVGRQGSEHRLARIARQVYGSALARRRTGDRTGLAGHDRLDELSASSSCHRTALRPRLLERGPIRISSDLNVLRECNLIISATNAHQLVVRTAHIARRPVVICDVATPSDVEPRISARRPEAVVLQGGVIKLPFGQECRIGGMPLPRGEIYGCLAETMIMGLEAIHQRYSYGCLSADRVRQITLLARKHGFDIMERSLDAARRPVWSPARAG